MKLTPAILLACMIAVAGVNDVLAASPQDDALTRRFFAKHCRECHLGAKPKGDFDLSRLGTQLT
jgi:hypothetical protein